VHSSTVTLPPLLKDSLNPPDQYIIRLPASIQSTFKELGLSDYEAKQYLDTVKKFEHYLEKSHLNYSLDQDYTSDPEYPDWMQLVITIRIKSDFNKVYSRVKSRLYDILGRTLGDNLYQKVIIKIQSH
jgi:hypothetical protein